MSIQSSAGAETAARHLIGYIDKLIAVREVAPDSLAHQLLLDVRKQAESIERVAKEGWY